jgi:prephenate dehydrogenase
MADEKVTILGLGLIGGSIGLALKAANLPNLVVVGHDLEGDAMKNALKRGAVDKTESTLEGAVDGARMVILAAPPLAVRLLLDDISDLLADGAIVTDVSSTKGDVARWAKQYLPPTVSFVGGHPMAGKEESGVLAADKDLFRGRAYAVVPSTSATEGAVKSVLGLVSILGAEPVFIDADEHDQYVAAISHMPMVVSSAMFTLVRGTPAWSEISPLSGPAFRDMTRLVSGDPQMNHDICVTNPEGVVHWIDRMIGELRRYRDLIMDNHEDLFTTFSAAQLQREAYLAGTDRPVRDQSNIPSASDQMSTLLFGGWMTERVKKYEKMMQRMERHDREGGGDDDDEE